MPVAFPLPNAARAASVGAAASPLLPKQQSVAPSLRADEAKDTPPPAKPQAVPSAPAATEAKPATGTQSAAGFLERLRRGLAPSEAQTAAPPPGGWLGRIRPARQAGEGTDTSKDAAPQPASNLPGLRPNDLRHYLNQRLAASAAEAANDLPRKSEAIASKSDAEKIGPVLKSIDAVLNHILASSKGGAPRALLVAGDLGQGRRDGGGNCHRPGAGGQARAGGAGRSHAGAGIGVGCARYAARARSHRSCRRACRF